MIRIPLLLKTEVVNRSCFVFLFHNVNSSNKFEILPLGLHFPEVFTNFSMASNTIWTFHCPVPTCNFSTHVPKDRLLHSMFCRVGEAGDSSQLTKVQFKCPDCGRSYTTKGSMKRHRSLTHEMPFLLVSPCATPTSILLPNPPINSRFRSQVTFLLASLINLVITFCFA